MGKKRLGILFVSISLSVCLGFFSTLIFSKEEGHHDINSLALVSDVNTLEESLSNADLIIKGTVAKKLETFKQDSGLETHLGPFLFDVTTFEIKVDKVLHGDVESESIILYQHGSSNDYKDSINHVKENEEVYLVLTKRPDGKGYWSFNFDDGIWKVKDGRFGDIVESKTDSVILSSLNKMSSNQFEEIIIDAAENN